MKRAVRLAGGAVAIAATALSIYLVARSWRGEDLTSYATPPALAGIGLVTAAYVASVGLSSLAWRQLLLGMGVRNRWTELCGIVASTQIGKYLPGNFAHHVGRGALSLERGIGPLPLLTTGLAEIALLCLASVAVGGVSLLLSGRIAILSQIGDPGLIVIVLLGAAVLIAGISMLHRVAPWLLARFAKGHAGHAMGSPPGAQSMLQAFGLYVLVYACFGIGNLGMATLMLPDVAQHGWLLLAAFSLAWIIGFATPGAPAGVGVREAVMLVLLQDAYAPADASAIVIAIRIATTLGDLVLLPLGWWQLRRTRPRATPRDSARRAAP